MKVLIAIQSCRRDQPYHQVVRNTWLTRCTVDYKFFLGADVKSDDEVRVDAPDGYASNGQKIRRVVQYALKNDYDFLFKCDVDTYVCVPRLINSGFECHDLIGYNGVYGGSGYWLSKKSMDVLKDCPVTSDLDDRWVGRFLVDKFGIQPFQDRRYHSATNEGPSPENDLITNHWYSDGDRVIRFLERIKLFPYHFEKEENI